MGSAVVPAGISNFVAPASRAAGRHGADRVRPAEKRAASENDTESPQPADFQGTRSTLPDGGVYQVADAVVFQLQLQSIVIGSDAGQNGAVAPNGSAANQAAPAPPVATSAAVPIANSGVAATASDAVQEADSSNSSVQSQEVQLRAALQALGLSPEVIQQFMTVARLLAQIAPSAFHDFVSQMVYLAKTQSGNAPAVPGNSAAEVTRAAAPASGSGAGPAATIEFTSVSLTETEVQVTSGQNGNTIAISAEEQTASVQLEVIQSAPQSLQSAASSRTPAANTAPAPAAKATASSA